MNAGFANCDRPSASQGSSEPLIVLENIARIYGHGAAAVTALAGVDLSIVRSEFVAAVGPSGSGKSTFLNLIGCLDTPSSGRYRFKGIDTGTLDATGRALLRRTCIGFVFQRFHLIKRASALENVELPLLYQGVSHHVRRDAAAAMLAVVGLSQRMHSTPDKLSGGQQQRVAIARALVVRPDLLIADEPTGALDSVTGAEIVGLLKQLNREVGTTIVIVTHDPSVAKQAARTIRFVDGHVMQGCVNDGCGSGT
ncbi:ABC transporter ATP-binding protein [Bradyrhizobium sp. LHD-71]|uniref:ABC transporter ATP-binding protein n=1 Tax=Bradyrhizobium sp. LHD-71 TaxID=3072141 RepID=UPI00280FA3E8|nr:ABC transporter ATP-binding protein [Bradyrhizobium sp. LHD-71]MDQ8728101.1 ABC transporter ATP-binding protein [Bradyrhizobium sp. LHD-71]